MLGTRLDDPADDAIVLNELTDPPPGQHPLGTMRSMRIERLRMARRGKGRSGRNPARRAAMRSVVPTGEVDSGRTTLPEPSTRAIASAARSV